MRSAMIAIANPVRDCHGVILPANRAGGHPLIVGADTTGNFIQQFVIEFHFFFVFSMMNTSGLKS